MEDVDFEIWFHTTFNRKFDGSKFKRILSPFALDFTRPGISVLEEFNFANPSQVGYFNSATDDNGELDIGGGIKLKRHKHRFIIITLNPGYEGTKKMNKALKERAEK